MLILKKYTGVIMLVLSLGLFGATSWAEEMEAPASASGVTAHLQHAIPFLENGDVANATTHIKFARRIANSMTSDNPKLKAAKSTLFEALKHSKEGDPLKSIEDVNKAIGLFNTL